MIDVEIELTIKKALSIRGQLFDTVGETIAGRPYPELMADAFQATYNFVTRALSISQSSKVYRDRETLEACCWRALTFWPWCAPGQHSDPIHNSDSCAMARDAPYIEIHRPPQISTQITRRTGVRDSFIMHSRESNVIPASLA